MDVCHEIYLYFIYMSPKNETSGTHSNNRIRRNIPSINDWRHLLFSIGSSRRRFYVEDMSINCRPDIAFRSFMGLVVINGEDLGSIYLIAC